MASKNTTRQVGRLTDEDWGLVTRAAEIKQAPNTASYAKHVLLKDARRVIALHKKRKR